MKKTLAVIVTYNRLNLLKKVIAALENQIVPCDILIVNNASTDDTENWINSHMETIPQNAPFQFLHENTGANLGGAGGFNYGMRRSVELGYDLVWIMDDDAIPKPDALEWLLDADKKLSEKKQTYGFLSSVVRWIDGSICVMNRQRLKDHYLEETDLTKSFTSNSLIPVECATFVSLLIPTKIIEKVGLPIKEFFIWCDDIEYTSRIALRKKIPSYIVPSSIIVHETNNNVGSDIVLDSPERIERYRYSFRNANYTYRHYSFRMYCSYLYNVAVSFILVWTRSKDNKLKRSRVIVSSFLKGLVFNPKVEYIKTSTNKNVKKTLLY